MKLFTMLLAGALLFGSWTGCSGDDEEDELPEVDCDTGAVPTFDEVQAFNKCASCHDSAKTGTARKEAPPTINFDTYAGAEPHATKAAEEVNEGAMPPADSGITLTADEKETLYRWALCGAME